MELWFPCEGSWSSSDHSDDDAARGTVPDAPHVDAVSDSERGSLSMSRRAVDGWRLKMAEAMDETMTDPLGHWRDFPAAQEWALTRCGPRPEAVLAQVIARRRAFAAVVAALVVRYAATAGRQEQTPRHANPAADVPLPERDVGTTVIYGPAAPPALRVLALAA